MRAVSETFYMINEIEKVCIEASKSNSILLNNIFSELKFEFLTRFILSISLSSLFLILLSILLSLIVLVPVLGKVLLSYFKKWICLYITYNK